MSEQTELDALLNELARNPRDRAEIEAEIERRFAQKCAVLVVDLCGFSRTTERHGIVQFLVMIQRMRSLARPVIEERGGSVIEAEADNLLAVFESVEQALSAARKITRRLANANRELPAEFHLYASVGIGYGSILRVDDEQIAGNEVNLAFKLGEDVADQGEILLTPAVAALLEAAEVTEERTVHISGIERRCYLLSTD